MRDETTSGNKPRLVTTLRKFIAAARLNPPSDESKTDARTMMLVLHSLAWHAKGVEEDAKTIRCDPSLKQIAELAHVSPRACQYALKELEGQKLIGVKRRGHHTSNVFTVHRSPILDMQPDCTSNPTSIVQNRPATEQFRTATDPRQTCNEAIQPCNTVATSGVVLQVLKNSGKVLQGEAQPQTPKSKPAPCSPSSKSQNQKLRNDINVLEFAMELRASFPGTGYEYVYALYDAVEGRAKALNEAPWEASSMIREQALKDQASGITIDRSYFEQIAGTSQDKSQIPRLADLKCKGVAEANGWSIAQAREFLETGKEPQPEHCNE